MACHTRRSERAYACRNECQLPRRSWDAPSLSSIHVSAVPEASGADRTLTGHATMVLARIRRSGHAPMRSCLHGLRAGGPGRDKSKQGQGLEGSVSQIVGHRPGRHFPIITGPSNRHNHYQRLISVSWLLSVSSKTITFRACCNADSARSRICLIEL